MTRARVELLSIGPKGGKKVESKVTVDADRMSYKRNKAIKQPAVVNRRIEVQHGREPGSPVDVVLHTAPYRVPQDQVLLRRVPPGRKEEFDLRPDGKYKIRVTHD